jgi:arylsulfatase A-like enzyme
VDRYDSEIWTADREFGRLVDYLSSKGLLDSTIIYVTGDHAEGLGEHGVQTHFNSVFDSETRTLGLFFVPGVEPRIVDQAVVHRDVVTTAMNLLNVRRDYDKLRGRNLIPTFRGESVLPDEVFIEIGGFGSRALRHMALVRWPFKLIYTLGTTNFKLYHLEDDPGEIRDVSTRYIGPFAEMKDRMLTHVDGKLQ